MAKIVFSAIVGDARKKIGGNVFTKVRSGAIVRRKVSPIQPRTAAQRNVRANFTSLAKAWSGASMDDTKRAGWNALAALYPVKDKFGASHILTGLQMFEKLNRALATITLGPIYDPPATLAAGFPGTLSLTATAPSTLSLNSATPPAATENGLIFAAAQQSPGRTYVGNRYRFIDVTGVGTAGPWTIGPGYVNKFGALVAGKKVSVLLVYMTVASGAKGTPSTILKDVS
jgi:hypothetical protein